MVSHTSVDEAQYKDAIAIVGVACNFPGGSVNLSKYWEMIEKNRSSIKAEMPSRLKSSMVGMDAANLPGIEYGGYLEDVAGFDAEFFRISPKEARLMDPQQRLMLELVWQCIEDSGHRASEFRGTNTGVYIGASNTDYFDLSLSDPENIEAHHNTAGGLFGIANRVSYFFDFHGPSVLIDTASSSSLVAISQAVSEIRSGNCDIAIAGGINLICSYHKSLAYYKAGMLSADGICRSFDQAANGYVRGEGGGVVLLKPYSLALEHGDSVYAVIRGAAHMHCGHSQALTVPSIEAQAELISKIYSAADVNFDSVDYIEAHGSGTPVGDPIELKALIKAWQHLNTGRSSSDTQRRCAVGSVKSNIGHLEAASGIAGLIKALACIKHRTIPATINHNQLNSGVSLKDSPFFIPTTNQHWPSDLTKEKDSLPLRCGISSFGIGGTNAHVLLEEAPAMLRESVDGQVRDAIFIFSAKSKASLKEYLKQFLWFMGDSPDERLDDIAYTLQIGRDAMSYRCAFVAQSRQQLIDQITEFLSSTDSLESLSAIERESSIENSISVQDIDLLTVANQWTSGVEVDWQTLWRGRDVHRISLPTYSFEHKTFWGGRRNQDEEISMTNEVKQGNDGLESVVKVIQEVISDVIEVEHSVLDPSLSISDFNLDSMGIRETCSELTQRLGIKVTPEIFYRVSTISEMAEYLINQNGDITVSQASVARKDEMPKGGVAIIGMSAQLPKSANLDEYWNNLCEGIDCISELSPGDPSRFDFLHQAEQHPEFPWITKGGWIDDIDHFDAEFFKITPIEAEYMDPQHRRLFQQTWHTLKQAGVEPSSLAGSRTGVFVGIMNNDYQELLLDNEASVEPFTPIGNTHSMAANRLSFILGCHGPSVAIDTACSSSLVAVHQAVEAINAGECDQAIVAGVNIISSARTSIAFSKSGMLSEDAHCKTFCRSANGYVRGEGVAVIMIKSLPQAIADDNQILAVISSTSINHGGRATSLTAPNTKAQSALLLDVYRKAGLDPSLVTYIEAHGTGTSLGDPVEFSALSEAFQILYKEYGHEAIDVARTGLGSVKTQLGHLEAAAGMAGLLKLVLSIQHKMLPGNINYGEVNSLIDVNNSPFYLQDNNQPWQPRDSAGNEILRAAGVSSFGYGGVNAHVVVQEYPGARTLSPAQEFEFDEKRYWIGKGKVELSLTVPQWVCADTDIVDKRTSVSRHVVLIGFEDVGFEFNQGDFTKIECRFELESAKAYEQAAIEAFRFVRYKAKQSGSSDEFIQVAVVLDERAPWINGVLGIFKTAAIENPRFKFQFIEISSDNKQDIYRILNSNIDSDDRAIRYENNQRYTRSALPLSDSENPPWQANGIYLITGGVGKIASLLVKQILKSCPEANIALMGRRAINSMHLSEKDFLSNHSKNIKYYQVDVCNREVVENAVRDIRACFGRISGVLHTAGIHEDDYIIRKTEAQFSRVLAPKVSGVINLDMATREDKPELFVGFSSFVGAEGNSGQADYAAANAFMDSYLIARSKACPNSKSLSINWPLWADGGMGVDSETEKEMREKLNMLPLPNQEALSALYQAINSDFSQVSVNYGYRLEATKKKATQTVAETEDLQKVNDKSIVKNKEKTDILKQAVNEELISIIADTVKLDREAIDSAREFSDYGINSIIVIRINRILSEFFPLLSKTFMYECLNINELTDYLLDHFWDECVLWQQSSLPFDITDSEVSDDAAIHVVESNEKNGDEDSDEGLIAIIGLAGHYPGADDLEKFWQLLVNGEEAIKTVPNDRWNAEDHYICQRDEAISKQKSYSKWGGFLDNVYDFDCQFFNISPKEALNIDPQERLFLQCCWEVFEDAGIPASKLSASNTGVFVGATKTGFEQHRSERGLKYGFNPRTSFSSMANRASYFFNLNGPSLSIDTMCSASLTALHEACIHINSGNCDLAIAGGVNLYLHPDTYLYLSQMRMLSDDGKCRTFGENCSGFVPGEGVGAVLLKPLSKARRDGDQIYAVIRGTSINHGGRTNGYTVPSPKAQKQLIVDGLNAAKLGEGRLSYIEAHGTGTALGDPIEINGIKSAFETLYNEPISCAIGSVKPNIGHLEAAAGIAGLTKVLLQMRHDALVPSINAETLNENIQLEGSGLYIQKHRETWSQPKIASVSSFGAGGSNAFVVVEEYHELKPLSSNPNVGPLLIVWSSRYQQGIQRYASKLREYVMTKRNDMEFSLLDMAYTLAVGRDAMPYRIALLVEDQDELLKRLEEIISHDEQESIESDSIFYSGEKTSLQKNESQKVQQWLSDGCLVELARIWVSGTNIDWSELYRKKDCRRVSLPTYPFNLKEISFDSILEKHFMETPKNTDPLQSSKRKKISLSSLDNQPSSSVENKVERVEVRLSEVIHKENSLDVSVVSELKKQLASLLYMDESAVQEEAVFVDMGLDSIIGAEWAKMISRHFSVNLSAAKLYDYPTVKKLAEFIKSQNSSMETNANDVKVEAKKEVVANSAPKFVDNSDIFGENLIALKKQLSELLFLEVEEISNDAVFVDLGLDSIIGAEWSKNIARHFNIPFSAAKLYDYPTILKLTEFVTSTKGKASDNTMHDVSAKCRVNEEEKSNSVIDLVKIDISPVLDALKTQLSTLLYLEADDISEDAVFIDLGLDSIIGAEWSKSIAQCFNINFSAAKLYDYPSLQKLSNYISNLLEQQKGEIHLVKEQTEKVSVSSNTTPIKRPKIQLSNTLSSVKPTTEITLTPPPVVENKSSEATQKNKSVKSDKIAIVGMAGKFPGADNITEFWENLKEGKDSVSDVVGKRWSEQAFYSDGVKTSEGKPRWMGALSNIENFDPLFFNISPTEAACMDPQQRLFLQQAWLAFEDAGYSREKLDGVNCGTYVGVMQNEYWEYVYDDSQKRGVAQTATGNSNAILAARIAYLLNLHGPALAIDTACSSSLVALHMACQSLRSRDVDMALVGGVTLYLSPDGYSRMHDAGMLSHSGHCYTFDNRADGFVPAEGAAAVVVKRLEDAIADDDYIYGVVIGSGLNQDGKTNGITAPSAAAQARLQKRVYEQFDIDPNSINYVEAHGTGTKLGDPIEIEALNESFETYGVPKANCAIGSVKTNIGHTSAAAGIVGLQKILLSMYHNMLPPSIHFNNINEHIDIDNCPFYVNTELKSWKTYGNQPRRAAMNCFGYSGTNVHLVVEEFQSRKSSQIDNGEHQRAFVLTAASEGQLRKYAENVSNYLRNLSSDIEGIVDRLAYTTYLHSSGGKYRLLIQYQSLDDLIMKLDSYIDGQVEIDGLYSATEEKVNSAITALFNDPDFEKTISAWIEQKKFSQLAKVWLSGVDIPWSKLYENMYVKRLPMFPGYVFAEQAYWTTPTHPTISSPKSQQVRPVVDVLKNKNLRDYHFATSCRLAAPLIPKNNIDGDNHYILVGVDMPEKINRVLSYNDGWQYQQIDCASVDESMQVSMLLRNTVTLMNQIGTQGEGRKFCYLFVTPEDSHPAYSALLGLVKSVTQENRKISAKSITFESLEQLPEDKLIQQLEQEFNSNFDVHGVHYNEEFTRYEERYTKATLTDIAGLKPMLKQKGIYLISGGLGGIGQLLSRYLREQYDAVVILVGRSPINDDNRDLLASLHGDSDSVEYIQVDIANRVEVTNLIQDISNRYGNLNGIFHAAGVIRDAMLNNKTADQIEEVCAPKIKGTLNLDACTRHLNLDFMMLFASIAGVTGNVGQLDYASANQFLDTFASVRNKRLIESGESGFTISVDWPLWTDGGMGVDAQKLEWFTRQTGMSTLSSKQGIEIIELALRQRTYSQLIPMIGDLGKIENYLCLPIKSAVNDDVNTLNDTSANVTQVSEIESVLEVFSGVLSISSTEIDVDTNIEEYGVDSILMMKILNELEKLFEKPLAPAILTEFPTIHSLCEHLKDEGYSLPKSVENVVEKVSQNPQPKRIEEEAYKSHFSTKSSFTTFSSPSRKGSKKVAIIGHACRLPQSNNSQEFWQNLCNGKNMVTAIPEDRWNEHSVYQYTQNGEVNYPRYGGFVDGLDEFDPQYFGMSEEEAMVLDPQQRLMLELVDELLHSKLKTDYHPYCRNMGVYIGAKENNYVKENFHYIPQSSLKNCIVSTIGNMIAARVANHFDFGGTVKTIDTACSSSLVAIHDAAESIISGENTMAIAGGVSLLLDPFTHVGFGHANVLSPDGKSYVFDKRANGIVLSEGAGVVLLKDYDTAVQDGDNIIATVSGSAVNNDGKTIGLTVPNQSQQKNLIEMALAQGEINPSDITYYEAHGTGTLLGDPIEVKAMTQAYRSYTQNNNYCALGSVKSNIGHTMLTAGVAGFIKVLLCMENKTIVPTIHCEMPHDRFDFSNSPFYPITKCVPWEGRNGKRIAAISSFGFGGTNCHMIVEDALAS